MEISSYYNSSRGRLSTESILSIQKTIQNRGYVSANKLVRFDNLTNAEKLNLKRVVQNIFLLRGIYNYFKETILVTELDEIIDIITPRLNKDIVNFMRRDPINVSTKYVADTPTSRYALLKKASILLYKLYGTSIIGAFDGSRVVVEEMLCNAQKLCCNSIYSLYNYSSDELDNINSYLLLITELLFNKQVVDNSRETVDRLARRIVWVHMSKVNPFRYILSRYTEDITTLEIIKERTTPCRIRKHNKGTISNICACGSTNLAVVGLVRVSNNETGKRIVKIKYKCVNCEIETEKTYDLLTNISLSVE